MIHTESLSHATPNAGWLDRYLVSRCLRAMQQVDQVNLRLQLPDGSWHNVATDPQGAPVTVTVHRWEVFRQILWSRDIGAGETFAEGWWETDDLPRLCALFVRADALWNTPSIVRTILWLPRFVSWKLQKNTRRGSRRNIQYHYDLSNDFYRLFLDDSMTYSCALFDRQGCSLHEAQLAKLDFACQALGLQKGQRVLDIGCGWGSFAIHAARNYGVLVHGISLSKNQLRLAQQRVQDLGLQQQIQLEFRDYRDLTDQYDHVVSIEMFEAVGHEYYRDFFAAVNRCLRRGGRFFLQTITIPDQRYDDYRRDFDFIKKHIFPGGLLASLERILSTAKHHTQLRMQFMRDIGPHYALTLRAWRERFLVALPQVLALGFDRKFTRLWEFYLASCEAAFAVRHIGDAQIVFQRES